MQSNKRFANQISCHTQADSMVWIDTSGLRKDQEGRFRESER